MRLGGLVTVWLSRVPLHPWQPDSVAPMGLFAMRVWFEVERLSVRPGWRWQRWVGIRALGALTILCADLGFSLPLVASPQARVCGRAVGARRGVRRGGPVVWRWVQRTEPAVFGDWDQTHNLGNRREQGIRSEALGIWKLYGRVDTRQWVFESGVLNGCGQAPLRGQQP